jgi:hypothetical protein
MAEDHRRDQNIITKRMLVMMKKKKKKMMMMMMMMNIMMKLLRYLSKVLPIVQTKIRSRRFPSKMY